MWTVYEAEILDGLKSFASNEMTNRLDRSLNIITTHPTSIPFRYKGHWQDFMRLRTVVAVYGVWHFAIPRPKAFLGHELFTNLVSQLQEFLTTYPANTFNTVRFSAAGKDSAVMQRLQTDLAQALNLKTNDEEADLFLRLRPAQLHDDGWELLVRLSPRPLATRLWRKCDKVGALNATIAACMIEMTNPRKSDIFINLMCGTGTLLIERLARMPAQGIVGLDTSAEMLACAQENIQEAHFEGYIETAQMDATQTDFGAKVADALVADLPWGQKVGSHDENVALYPKFLDEAARLAKPKARLVVLTHEVKFFENLLKKYESVWTIKRMVKVYQGGLHPRIYLLERLS